MIIFDLTRNNWKYKGVFFAEVDSKALAPQLGDPPKDFIIGFMGLIWVDENDLWHGKLRLKFPSGAKEVAEVEIPPEIKCNEIYIIHQFNAIPLIHKKWYPNPCGTKEGILKILEEADMIESVTVL